MTIGKLCLVPIHLVILTGILYHEAMIVSSLASAEPSSSYNLIANHRPRFKIPRGNLSYYRNPHWEILYFLKFGTFPFYSNSSPYFNRTQFLNKMKLIKILLDREHDNRHDDDENQSSYQFHQKSHTPHNQYDADNILPNPNNAVSLLGLGSTEEDEKSLKMKTAYYNNNLALPIPLQDSVLNVKRSIDFKPSTERHIFPTSNYMNYFPADIIDPNWIRRVAKEGSQREFHRSKKAFTFNKEYQFNDEPGLAAEMTIERTVGKKFHTQGWK